MKLRKWVKVMISIIITILIGGVIVDLATIKTENNGTTCNGKLIKICGADHNYDL